MGTSRLEAKREEVAVCLEKLANNLKTGLSLYQGFSWRKERRALMELAIHARNSAYPLEKLVPAIWLLVGSKLRLAATITCTFRCAAVVARSAIERTVAHKLNGTNNHSDKQSKNLNPHEISLLKRESWPRPRASNVRPPPTTQFGGYSGKIA